MSVERTFVTQIMNNVKDYFKLNNDLFIENIMVDSRLKSNHAIFFCLMGLTVDGHNFIDKAIENGAVAIVCSKDVKQCSGITYIKVDDTTRALNDFASYFYGYPSKKLKMYAVTGTNGKTTTSYITFDILNKLKQKAGYIGTLGYEFDGKMHEQYFTTPNINDLHLMLKQMCDAECKACAIEVSSQGLDLHRTDSVDFDAAVYTNLTHDHLDYHKTYENYFNAKARLFENLKKEAVACINIDDEYGLKMIERCHCKVVTYGIDNDADYRAEDVKLYENCSQFILNHNGNRYPIRTNLVAKFNILNLLGCLSSLVETGYAIEEIIPLLTDIREVPGRCMHINEGQNFNVIVDYAHTPDGFIKILDYAKAITPSDKKISVVFGLRGSGDVEKRAICGQIVDKYCDEIYITHDDNHEEDINSILDGIESGIKNHKAHRYVDRAEAIKEAIKHMEEGNTLCILSKGIETYCKVNHQIVPYDGDHIVASRAIKKYMIS